MIVIDFWVTFALWDIRESNWAQSVLLGLKRALFGLLGSMRAYFYSKWPSFGTI